MFIKLKDKNWTDKKILQLSIFKSPQIPSLFSGDTDSGCSRF